MARPTADQVHLDSTLTNMAVSLFQDNQDYIWHQVFPIIPVDHKSGDYFVFNSEYGLRDHLQERPPASESAGTEWTLSTDEYRAKVWAVHIDLSDQVEGNADFDTEQAIVRTLTQQVHQHMEKRVAAEFFAGSIWTGDQTGVASGPTTDQFVQWDETAADPVSDIMTRSNVMKARSGKRPNTLVVGPATLLALSLNANLLERFSGSGTTMLAQDQIARALGVDRVLVADAITATSDEGQTLTTDFIFGDMAFLAYAERGGPSMFAASAGYVFNWTGLDKSEVSATGPNIYQFYIPEKRAWRYEAQIAYDLKVTSAALGTMFLETVAT